LRGSRADAEDTVQDAYLRWHRTPIEEVRSAEAWLVTTGTRLAIDRLRAAQTERAHYVGPWLPEPFVDEATAPPADVPAELSSSLSVAFLAVLERLAPEERAAFLLHDVFDSEYAEIAEILGKSEEACRQTVSRARKRVREDRPRVQVSESARQGVIERFVNALLTQNKSELMNVLAVDVGWTSDGGGKAKAARKVLRGNEYVADFIIGVIGRYAPRVELRPITVNGELGLALYGDGHLMSVISFVTDGERIFEAYSVLNPEKLQGMQQWGRVVR
jgi:RNA polymerase sigma-70 factor (ECF subfamily)